MSKYVRVSRELVEDLNLQRFLKRTNPHDVLTGDGWNWHLIDARRLKRELNRLPKLRAAAKANFDEQLRNIEYQYRTYEMEYYYTEDGNLVPREMLGKIRDLLEQNLVKSIQPTADMLRSTHR